MLGIKNHRKYMGTPNRRLSALIFLALLLVACAREAAPSELKVYVAMPLGLEVGQDMLHAAQLALDQAGSRAGQTPVILVPFDTSDPEGSPISPDLEAQAAHAAGADPAVVAYLGAATSDQARASLPILNQAGILQLSPAATWPGLTQPGFGPGEPGRYYPTGRRHFFRMVPTDDLQGAVAARWAHQLGVATLVIVDDTTAYGAGVAGIFEVTAQDLGLEILHHATFPAASVTTAELDALVAAILDRQPDLVYLGASLANGGNTFVRALRDAAPHIAIMAPDGMAQDQLFTDIGTSAAEGIYVTQITIPAELHSAAGPFRETYQAAYGKEPPPYALNTYEAMSVILTAIERAETPTRDGVLEAARNLGLYAGVLGEWSFDVTGDISITAISGLQARNGVWAFQQVLK